MHSSLQQYDNDCRMKKFTVKKCLDTYNRNKTTLNREAVFKARKDYKYACRKQKLKFQKERCLKMDEIRRNNPKGFSNFFKKKEYHIGHG